LKCPAGGRFCPGSRQHTLPDAPESKSDGLCAQKPQTYPPSLRYLTSYAKFPTVGGAMMRVAIIALVIALAALGLSGFATFKAVNHESTSPSLPPAVETSWSEAEPHRLDASRDGAQAAPGPPTMAYHADETGERWHRLYPVTLVTKVTRPAKTSTTFCWPPVGRANSRRLEAAPLCHLPGPRQPPRGVDHRQDGQGATSSQDACCALPYRSQQPILIIPR
jgi:hypothetical protein